MITSRSIGYIKEEKLSLLDYTSLESENGYQIICHQTHLKFLRDFLLNLEQILKDNNIEFSEYIKLIIQDDDKKFITSYTASSVCIQNLDLWIKSDEDELLKLTIHLVYITLLSREFIENSNFVGIGFFTKKKDVELRDSAHFLVTGKTRT